MKKSPQPHTPKLLRDHQHGDQPLPLDGEYLNADRALWAAVALEAFQRQTGADFEDALSDLLADLMHWCDRFGQPFQRELRRAVNHYKEEARPRSEPRSRGRSEK